MIHVARKYALCTSTKPDLGLAESQNDHLMLSLLNFSLSQELWAQLFKTNDVVS